MAVTRQNRLPGRQSRRVRGTDDFAVRRWLQLGVASAGMGAALLGFNLLGADVAVAAADDTTSASSASDTSDTAGSKRDAEDSREDADADDAGSATGQNDGSRAARGDVAHQTAGRRTVRAVSKRAAAGKVSPSIRLPAKAGSGPLVSAQPTSGPTVEAAASADLNEVSRPRRRSVNEAPTVAPVQLTGRVTGPVTGTVGAVDPEGDPLAYRLARAPREGSVQLGTDGTYAYTPDADFDGVDTFRVLAIDLGSRPKLFRPRGTRANAIVNQGAITFDFTYTDDDWTAERRQALQDVANDLVNYFTVTSPVTLTYDVGVEDGGALASAGSALVTGSSGFWRTVVQNKLLSGTDANAGRADGQINWNFDYPWSLGDTVGADDYDFTAIATHELLHSFGFLSYVGAPGDNTNTAWSVFASFVVTEQGVHPINGRYQWDNSYDPNLEGAAGGLFFGGSSAVAAYGGLVPLYTPDPWEPGSSMSHLDDATFTGANEQLMNAKTADGLGVRVLSAVELGILKDLGYQMFPHAPTSAVPLVGFVILFRRRRAKSGSGAR